MKYIILFSLLSVQAFVDSTLCPDKVHNCPIWATCCENRDETYGCCPYKEADCCSDFIHCCPPGLHCNVTSRSCDSGPKLMSTSFNWMVPHYKPDVVVAAFKPTSKVEEVVMNKMEEDTSELEYNLLSDVRDKPCPDGESCDDSATCCQTGNGTFGCCPYRNADCCSDKVHCCPEDYKCDTANRRCVKKEFLRNFEFHKSMDFPIYNILKVKFEKPAKLERNSCPVFSVCDFLGKICCSSSDGSHYCCPRETVCSRDEVEGCVKQVIRKETEVDDESVQYTQKLPLVQGEVVCPDKTESCPSKSTCCLMASGRYGCCPLPSATCCSDKLHCCPQGYACVEDHCEKNPTFNFFDQLWFLQRVPLQ